MTAAGLSRGDVRCKGWPGMHATWDGDDAFSQAPASGGMEMEGSRDGGGLQGAAADAAASR